MSGGWSSSHDEARNTIHVTFAEDASLGDVDNAAQTMESEGQLQQHRIFDFRQCAGLTPTTTELLDIARRSADWQIDDLKIAWLAGTQADAGLLRIVTSKFSEKSMRVFTSEAEATRWLSGTDQLVQDSPVQIDHKPIRLRGQISLDDVMRTQQELRAAEDFVAEQSLLWDLRESQLIESLAEVKDLAVFIVANHNRDRSGAKSAVLVDSHIMDLLIREMAKVDDWPEQDVKVFRSYRDAMAWLGA